MKKKFLTVALSAMLAVTAGRRSFCLWKWW